MFTQLQEAVAYIQQNTEIKPVCGLVLGSGLGNIIDEMEISEALSYSEIPHFPVSTVKGHSGKLLFGEWHGLPMVVMQGRFHYYEGYTLEQVTFPIRVIKLLGADILLLTNASGGLNPEIKTGELMVVTDHINLNSNNPLRGINIDELGPRFPDQHAVYDKVLQDKAIEIAVSNKIICHAGIYVGVTGPTFESPAEYRYMRIIGGDAVGMSTVPEAIVANHANMRVFCLSVICDEGNPAMPTSVTHDEVITIAKRAEGKMAVILKNLIQSI
ncbi:MAG: purine-nucleoside phosphorylase [Chitinophagales bacterium]|nr:purine-nucleoside phosphorylase [Chitinophagales bacterium]